MRRWIYMVLLAALLLAGCKAAEAPAPPPESPETQAEPALPPEPPPQENVPLPEPEPGELIQVIDYLPEVRVDLRYAGENNFTGQVIYDFTGAYLRYGTVQKLEEAQTLLAEEGYGLLIWDAFRPVEVQFHLWEVCPDPVYVANPERGFSAHSRGNTVDVTLVTLEGESVAMPTDFDDFSTLADRDYGDVPESAAAHARLLEDAMTACGFRPYQGEWWHFTDTDDYPVEEDFTPES